MKEENIPKIVEVEKEAGELFFHQAAILTLSICTLLLGGIQIYGFITDKSIRKYIAPSNVTSLDAPIELVRLDAVENKKDLQNLILGFTRKVIRAQHPRNRGEVTSLYHWLAENSIGRTQDDYRDRLSVIESIQDNLRRGIYVTLYPVSHFNIKVRKDPKRDDQWIVAFPAVRVKKDSNRSFGRSYVDARYYIRIIGPSLDHAESKIVFVKSEFSETVDQITEEKRTIK